MSNEELVKLIKSENNSSEAMGQLYLNNKKYIYTIAKKYSSIMEIDDLMQEAYWGLANAVTNYDCDKEVKFITYAAYWIKQAIVRYIENTKQLVRMPSYLHEKVRKFKKCTQYIKATYNREPNAEEYLYIAGVEADEVETIKNVMYSNNIKSLDETLIREENITLSDTISDNTNMEDTITDKILQQQLQSSLWVTVKEILKNDDYYNTLEARYKKNLTLKACGILTGTTIEQIRLRHDKAIRKLKFNKTIKKLSEDYGIMTSRAYRGGFASFKNYGTSSTEYVALNLIDIELDMIKFYISSGIENLLTSEQKQLALKNGLL